MPAIGLIVEGPYDEATIPALLERLSKEPVTVHARVCGGGLRGKLSRLLRELKYAARLDKALAVADADGRDVAAYRQRLESEIQNQDYSFPVRIVVVVRELESWLLADPQAVSQVCAHRGIPQNLAPLTDSPEAIHDPKEKLEVLLGKAGVPYTKVVAREIAEKANLEQLEYWCPSYRTFKNAFEDC